MNSNQQLLFRLTFKPWQVKSNVVRESVFFFFNLSFQISIFPELWNICMLYSYTLNRFVIHMYIKYKWKINFLGNYGPETKKWPFGQSHICHFLQNGWNDLLLLQNCVDFSISSELRSAVQLIIWDISRSRDMAGNFGSGTQCPCHAVLRLIHCSSIRTMRIYIKPMKLTNSLRLCVTALRSWLIAMWNVRPQQRAQMQIQWIWISDQTVIFFFFQVNAKTSFRHAFSFFS